MEKQIKKLNLNKRTISNLNVAEMNEKLGGHWTNRCQGHSYHCSRWMHRRWK
jgi:natural product precursor